MIKGAPEMILDMCVKENQKDYFDKLTSLIHKGYRILAMACKKLNSSQLTQK